VNLRRLLSYQDRCLLYHHNDLLRFRLHRSPSWATSLNVNSSCIAYRRHYSTRIPIISRHCHHPSQAKLRPLFSIPGVVAVVVHQYKSMTYPHAQSCNVCFNSRSYCCFLYTGFFPLLFPQSINFRNIAHFLANKSRVRYWSAYLI
jgi:hypothetical protein